MRRSSAGVFAAIYLKGPRVPRRTLLCALCQSASNCRRDVQYAAGRASRAVQLVAPQFVAAKKPRKTEAIAESIISKRKHVRNRSGWQPEFSNLRVRGVGRSLYAPTEAARTRTIDASGPEKIPIDERSWRSVLDI
jgi:hypothetical protein